MSRVMNWFHYSLSSMQVFLILILTIVFSVYLRKKCLKHKNKRTVKCEFVKEKELVVLDNLVHDEPMVVENNNVFFQALDKNIEIVQGSS